MLNRLMRKLEHALHTGTLIRLERELESGYASGYVIAVGTRWVHLAIVSDDILPAGYQAFRTDDISVFHDPAPHADFVEAALLLRSVRKPAPLKIDMTDAGSILATAHQAFDIVTIHREIDDPEICHIGQVHSLNDKNVCLIEVTSDAVLEDVPRCYPLNDITRIDFGGPYEDALASVCLKTYRRPLGQW